MRRPAPRYVDGAGSTAAGWFGATPEDRARLRITFAQADEAEAKAPVARAPQRRRVLRAIEEPPAAGE